MLRPSYTELMNVINSDNDADSQVTSRYTIVLATAKRARQIIDESQFLEHSNTDKAVSIAVNEIRTGVVKVKTRDNSDVKERTPSDGPKKEQFFITEI